jgi:hypothetical protein
VYTTTREGTTIFIALQNTGGFLSLMLAVSHLLFGATNKILYYSKLIDELFFTNEENNNKKDNSKKKKGKDESSS